MLRHWPNEKLIFEIPLYSMPKEQFDKKWAEHKGKLKDEWIKIYGMPAEKAEKTAHKLCHPYHLWTHNQIIGYLQISVSKADIWFNECIVANQKIFTYSSRKKKYIEDQGSLGWHIGIKPYTTNEQIKESILNEIQSFQRNHKQRFLDTTIFEAIFPYIDMRRLIDSCNISTPRRLSLSQGDVS